MGASHNLMLSLWHPIADLALAASSSPFHLSTQGSTMRLCNVGISSQTFESRGTPVTTCG